MTALILLSLIATAAMAVHAILHAPASIRVADVNVPIRDLPTEFEGYTMAVLSDIHYSGPIPGRGNAARAAQLVRRVQPDLIVLLGDYAASFKHSKRASGPFYRHALRALAPVFRGMSAPDGIVAVIGNHEYFFNAGAVIKWLESLGIRVLVNDRLVLKRDGRHLAIAGMDDASMGTPDPYAGCADLPHDVPRIVLSHHPDGILHLAPDARADLMLSGHTHGGQVVLPFVGALIRHAKTCGRHTASGWIPNDRAPLYVSRGIGAQIPLRFNCPPEVVIVRLQGAGFGVQG